ncbi:anti-sigma factor [Nocardioides antri]|uniref:Regulator of SigK n=1 Tax=Nocardioides antri TaxID=2607659 RepID=A0A5B1LUE6_9ACTN|nr:anti-sigma factor [Nocardioides antri]KAA1424054.1 anti-sigma factor [Nocardioides antri]
MTDHDQTNETRQEWNDVHALSGAYAVDALDDLERARFESHLRNCPDCREEVDGLREAAAFLAVDPVEPPARLRADILAGIEAIRPLPPVVAPEPQSEPDDGRRRWLTTGAPLLVAAALVLVALATTAWLRPWADDESTPLTATERVLTADDADRFVQRFDDGSRATVVVSRSEGRAVVLTEDMAPAPEGKDYQLWLQDPSGDIDPAGLMPDQADATVLLEGDASDATWAGITVEPDGGSPQPTTDPIAEFVLDA